MTKLQNKFALADTSEEPLCRCGKERDKIHCPCCGSLNVYGKDANSVRLDVPENLGGGYVIARGFRCRRCAHNFNETSPCEAPVFETKSMKQRRIEDGLRENLAEIERTKGRRAMLEFVARSQGLDPHAPVGDWRKSQPDNAGNSSDPVAFINSIPNEHRDASRSYTDDLSHGRDNDNEVVIPPGGSVLDKE